MAKADMLNCMLDKGVRDAARNDAVFTILQIP
jgi:hypothetical protein